MLLYLLSASAAAESFLRRVACAAAVAGSQNPSGTIDSPCTVYLPAALCCQAQAHGLCRGALVPPADLHW